MTNLESASGWTSITNRLPTRVACCFDRRAMRKTKSRRKQETRAASRRAEKPVPYQKAALRSRAFARAILDAKPYVTDLKRLRTLFEEAAQKAASIPTTSFRETWPYLQAMLRLVRAYSSGEYRAISQNSLLTIIAALNYLIDPFDLIPDEIPFLGFLDDANVMEFAVRKTKDDLDDFMTWETVAS